MRTKEEAPALTDA